MVRSTLVSSDGSNYPVAQYQILSGEETAVFNELSKAVTMATEPWLREVLKREVLADMSGAHFVAPPTKGQAEQPYLNWLVSLTGSAGEILLMRLSKSNSEYFAPADDEEANAALDALIKGWAELWFATVAELLDWQVAIETNQAPPLMPGWEKSLPWYQANVAAGLTCSWTFADGGVVLLEYWLPVSFVRRVAGYLLNGAPERKSEPRALRADVVRTYRKTVHRPSGHTPVLPVRFPALEETTSSHPGSGMELLKDVYLDVACVLAKTEMRIGQLLELKPGDIVELGKLVGEPMELSLNDYSIARGEVLVLDDLLGIRISEVINVSDRLQKAQDSQG